MNNINKLRLIEEGKKKATFCLVAAISIFAVCYFTSLVSFFLLCVIGGAIAKLFKLDFKLILPIIIAIGFVVWIQPPSNAVIFEGLETAATNAITNTGADGGVDTVVIEGVFDLIRVIIGIVFVSAIAYAGYRAWQGENYGTIAASIFAGTMLVAAIEIVSFMLVGTGA